MLRDYYCTIIFTQQQIAETKPSQPPQTTSLEKAKVMFPYEADQSDELSVEEGETVDVINKETNQDGWWLIRGKKGKGLVPDNFLSLIQSPKSHTSTSNGKLLCAMFIDCVCYL